MKTFWVLVALAFVSLLLTVNYVSRRSSQVEPTASPAAPHSAPAAPAWKPPPPRPRAAPSSGALYKCIDAKGHNSFQSQPCPPGSTQAWVRDATPEPASTRAQWQQQARARQPAERNAAARASRQTYDPGVDYGAPGASTSAACEAARAADAAYRRQPLRHVTHDGLRRHGEAIQAACY